MSRRIPRRQFLRSAPAVGALAWGGSEGLAGLAEPRSTVLDHGKSRLRLPYRAPAGDYPIRPKPHAEVRLRNGFWEGWVRRNAEVTIPFEFRKREGTRGPLRGGVLEAAMLSLETRPDAWLRDQVEARVGEMAAGEPPASNRDFEIAATWYRSTGRKDLLDRAIRSAERLHADFLANDPPFSGGERDAWNCAQLYRVTGNPEHLWLARHYLDIRGREDSVGRSRHNQSYMPVLEQSEAVGHAVNCVTLIVSMVEIGVLTGRDEYVEAAGRMWHDAVSRKMYVTGGVGSTGNEGFGEPWSLPNIDAYSETCAVLMFITLNHDLFLATGDGCYIDVMERGMYNNALSGVSVSGDHYFYVNRLASAGDGRDLRWQHASLECCPPNLVRFLARMPGYVYAQGHDDAVYVNLYVSSEATFETERGTIGLSVDSEMPWGGRSSITVATEEEVEATIRLRIPGWARDEPAPGGLYRYTDPLRGRPVLSVNGRTVDATPDDLGYVSLRRTWGDGDVIEIDLPMEVRKVVADPRVREDRGRFAVERGPVVFCCERPEAEGGEVLTLLFDDTRELTARFDHGLFGGATVIDAAARSVTDPSAPLRPVTLIPYHLWANRGAGQMSVWLSREEYRIGDTGPTGGFIFYENPDHVANGWRYLEAAPFDQSGGAKWG
ncbi:MAG TPA: beta-L-arabinofuranosidase domain-containing protein, partial [Longimicrobiales bacterium]|nr:beta-L-arabinofuranosidase domain-containing protein [Longimicrobiales bacterium]